jgi:hypothetical protein
MSDPNIADWLGGAGQAAETIFVIAAFFFARSELRNYMGQRQLGHEQAKAEAAVDVWDTVVRALDLITSMSNLPIQPGANDYVSAQLEGWGERTSKAVEGLSRSYGRAILLLGETQIQDDLMHLADTLNALTSKSIELRFPASSVPKFPTEEFALASTEQKLGAQAASNAILRKLNGVALRHTQPLPAEITTEPESAPHAIHSGRTSQ